MDVNIISAMINVMNNAWIMIINFLGNNDVTFDERLELPWDV